MSAQPAVHLAPEPPPRPVRLARVVAPTRPPVSIVVPCYDEVEGIPVLLERLGPLGALGWEAVFVDDGSRDGTFAALLGAARTRPWMHVVRHGSNLGLGAALRTGFARARAPIVCTIDSDCTYGPERLPELVALIEEGADIATASPWHPRSAAGDGGRVRVLLSRGVSRLYRLLIGRDVYTFTCLYRAYRREVVETTPFLAAGFASVAELLLRGILRGFRVRELPMQLGPRRFGVSKMRIGEAVVGHLGLLALTAALVAARWARGRAGLSQVPA